MEPLVSFYRSPKDKNLLPSVEEFRGHLRRFRKRYPWVRLFSTWNEANFTAAQPTGRDPARTARFYRAAREECEAQVHRAHGRLPPRRHAGGRRAGCVSSNAGSDPARTSGAWSPTRT